MALSGTKTGAVTYGGNVLDVYNLWIYWTATKNATSWTVYRKLYIRKTTSPSYTGDAGGTFCGSVFSKDPAYLGSASTLLASDIITVNADANGNGSVNVGASFGLSIPSLGIVYTGTIASTSYALDQITAPPPANSPTITATALSVIATQIIIGVSASENCNAWYYRLNGGTWVLFDTQTVSTTQYAINGLTPNTPYSIECAAQNPSGVMGYSAPLSVVTLGATDFVAGQALDGFDVEDSFKLELYKQSSSFYDVLQIKVGTTVIKTVGGYLSLADILLTDDELIAVYGLCSSSEQTKTITFIITSYESTTNSTLVGSNTVAATGTLAGTSYVNAVRSVPYVRVLGAKKPSIEYTKVAGHWMRGVE